MLATGPICICLHAISRGLLLHQLLFKQTAVGLSRVCQDAWLVVFLARHLELLSVFVSLADSFVKVAHIGLALAIVLLMRYSTSLASTWEGDHDTMHYAVVLVPPLVLAMRFNRVGMILEIFHQYSYYLEAVALAPQFWLLYKRGSVQPTALAFTLLAGAESVVHNSDLLTDSKTALETDAYGLYTAWAQVAVMVVGCLALLSQALWQGRRTAGGPANESANKPAFNEVWDARSFTFTASAQDPEAAAVAGAPGPSQAQHR